MPPVTRKKSPKNELDAARKKELLCAKERIMRIKRNTLNIIEIMLEENVSKEWFLKNCGLLCQADYQDVVQERSIEHTCGYPLCDNALKKVLKQQYHISRVTNKVYDLTERKCFCSNECYKASNFLKAQLSEVPLYMRKSEEAVSVELLQNCDNQGSAGEEVVFHRSIKKDEIEKVHSEVHVPVIPLSNMLQEEVKGCEEQLSNLKITENVYEKPYVFKAQAGEETEMSPDKDKSSSESSDQEDGENEVERKLFPEYDNVSVLCNKHMPINERTKKALLISPLKPSEDVPEPCPLNLCIEFIKNIFYDWFTEDTMKYLLGEKKMYSLKADLLFKTMTDESSSSEIASAAKNEYIDLCLKIDELQQGELSDSFELEIEPVNLLSDKTFDIPKELNKELCSNPNASNYIPKRKPRKKSKEKNKSVSFSQDAKKKSDFKEIHEESKVTEPLPEPAFPLIDSLSQNALRRQVLTSKLKPVYFDILPVIGLHYRDIREGILKIIETFSLTPTNITYKPKEMKSIAVVLFRLLTKTRFQDLHDDSKFSKLCETSTTKFNIPTQEIEDLVCDLISINQLTRLEGTYDVKK